MDRCKERHVPTYRTKQIQVDMIRHIVCRLDMFGKENDIS